uniref:Uncharacterized protein n=1 Tax=Leersia perrieri TaxID=77586 RepID=A0A0D9VJ42_9ORYZ
MLLPVFSVWMKVMVREPFTQCLKVVLGCCGSAAHVSLRHPS